MLMKSLRHHRTVVTRSLPLTNDQPILHRRYRIVYVHLEAVPDVGAETEPDIVRFPDLGALGFIIERGFTNAVSFLQKQTERLRVRILMHCQLRDVEPGGRILHDGELILYAGARGPNTFAERTA